MFQGIQYLEKNDWCASWTWNHLKFDQLNDDDESINVKFWLFYFDNFPKAEVIFQVITKPEILKRSIIQPFPELEMASGRDNLIDQRSAKLLSAGLVFVTSLTALDIRSVPLS